MYVRNLRASNFRCFDWQVKAEFQYPGRVDEHGNSTAQKGFENLNLIIGENGSGKSSVLKGVALAVLGSVLPSSGFRPYYLVRGDWPGMKSEACMLNSDLILSDGATRFSCTLLRFGSEDEIDPRMTGPWEPDAQSPGPPPPALRTGEGAEFFLCGYGATRRSEDSGTYEEASRLKQRSLRYQRVAGLFEEHFSLTAFSQWLARAASDGGRAHRCWDSIATCLDKLLAPSGIEWTRGHQDGEAFFRMPDKVEVPFDALSDGYRAFLSWAGDLLRHMAEATPEGMALEDLRGTVLVDEVDLHLHPAWQTTLLTTLAQALPKLQFIMTSHSPILAGCLPAENILLVERNAEGIATIRVPDRDVYGKAVDEILVSSYFGLKSTLPPELARVEKQRELERAELARKFLQSTDPQKAMEYLRALTPDASHPG